jgi:hypothetical protein
MPYSKIQNVEYFLPLKCPRVKDHVSTVFLWLALCRKQWTADRQRRHGLDASEVCFLCDQKPETIDHIVVSCSFSKQVWWSVLVVIGHQQALPNSDTICD